MVQADQAWCRAKVASWLRRAKRRKGGSWRIWLASPAKEEKMTNDRLEPQLVAPSHRLGRTVMGSLLFLSSMAWCHFERRRRREEAFSAPLSPLSRTTAHTFTALSACLPISFLPAATCYCHFLAMAWHNIKTAAPATYNANNIIWHGISAWLAAKQAKSKWRKVIVFPTAWRIVDDGEYLL